MKRYSNGADFFRNQLAPKKEDPFSWNPFNSQNQQRLNEKIEGLTGISIDGELTLGEIEIINKTKLEIQELRDKFQDVKPERLDMDLAIIFHRNFKKLGFGRYHCDDFGMWRWISINYFLNECFWRWSQDDFKKTKLFESSRSCFQRLVGDRNRRIYPLWYFTIGERLYDKNFGYSLLEKLAEQSKGRSSGGFGNLNNNLNDTSLISPNEHVSKTMSKLLLLGETIANNDEVANAFKRYNGFKRRLLSYGSETIFESEICIFNKRKAS